MEADPAPYEAACGTFKEPRMNNEQNTRLAEILSRDLVSGGSWLPPGAPDSRSTHIPGTAGSGPNSPRRDSEPRSSRSVGSDPAVDPDHEINETFTDLHVRYVANSPYFLDEIEGTTVHIDNCKFESGYEDCQVGTVRSGLEWLWVTFVMLPVCMFMFCVTGNASWLGDE